MPPSVSAGGERTRVFVSAAGLVTYCLSPLELVRNLLSLASLSRLSQAVVAQVRILSLPG